MPGPDDNGLALVLSGGAARGAYEAGVLRFIFDDLVPRLGPGHWPSFLSGSSVGAISAMAVASRDRGVVTQLSRTWQTLTIDQIFDFQVTRVGARWLRGLDEQGPFALLDPKPLVGLLRRYLPMETIQGHVDTGIIDTLVLCATDLATGRNTLFVDTGGRPLGRRLGSTVVPTRLGIVHCIASAAIPFLFPAVRVEGRFYVDGGLRQNTPLRPMLRAGARRVLVIGLSAPPPRPTPDDRVIVPNLPFLAGKTLNALLLDPVKRDIRTTEKLNQVLEWGAQRYGAEFLDAASAELGVHPARTLLLLPSQDLGRLAFEAYGSSPPKASASIRTLLRVIADRTNPGESDLLSYLLFDQAYTGMLEALGFEDARRREEDIARFLEGHGGDGVGPDDD